MPQRNTHVVQPTMVGGTGGGVSAGGSGGMMQSGFDNLNALLMLMLNQRMRAQEGREERGWRTGEREAEQGWRSGENTLQRGHETELQKAQFGEAEKNRAFQEKLANWQTPVGSALHGAEQLGIQGGNPLETLKNYITSVTQISLDMQKAVRADQFKWQNPLEVARLQATQLAAGSQVMSNYVQNKLLQDSQLDSATIISQMKKLKEQTETASGALNGAALASFQSGYQNGLSFLNPVRTGTQAPAAVAPPSTAAMQTLTAPIQAQPSTSTMSAAEGVPGIPLNFVAGENTNDPGLVRIAENMPIRAPQAPTSQPAVLPRNEAEDQVKRLQALLMGHNIDGKVAKTVLEASLGLNVQDVATLNTLNRDNLTTTVSVLAGVSKSIRDRLAARSAVDVNAFVQNLFSGKDVTPTEREQAMKMFDQFKNDNIDPADLQKLNQAITSAVNYINRLPSPLAIQKQQVALNDEALNLAAAELSGNAGTEIGKTILKARQFLDTTLLVQSAKTMEILTGEKNPMYDELERYLQADAPRAFEAWKKSATTSAGQQSLASFQRAAVQEIMDQTGGRVNMDQVFQLATPGMLDAAQQARLAVKIADRIRQDPSFANLSPEQMLQAMQADTTDVTAGAVGEMTDAQRALMTGPPRPDETNPLLKRIDAAAALTAGDVRSAQTMLQGAEQEVSDQWNLMTGALKAPSPTIQGSLGTPTSQPTPAAPDWAKAVEQSVADLGPYDAEKYLKTLTQPNPQAAETLQGNLGFGNWFQPPNLTWPELPGTKTAIEAKKVDADLNTPNPTDAQWNPSMAGVQGAPPMPNNLAATPRTPMPQPSGAPPTQPVKLPGMTGAGPGGQQPNAVPGAPQAPTPPNPNDMMAGAMRAPATPYGVGSLPGR